MTAVVGSGGACIRLGGECRAAGLLGLNMIMITLVLLAYGLLVASPLLGVLVWIWWDEHHLD